MRKFLVVETPRQGMVGTVRHIGYKASPQQLEYWRSQGWTLYQVPPRAKLKAGDPLDLHRARTLFNPPRPGQPGFVRQLARKVARRRPRSRTTGRRRKIADPLAYAATVERRRLANPALAIFGNRPRGVTIARQATLAEYRDPAKGRDTWFHKFGKGVRITGEPDGSVRYSKPGTRLWEPDGQGHYWLENPGGARGGSMAKRRKRRRSRAAAHRARARTNKRGTKMRHRNDPGRGRRRRRHNPFGRSGRRHRRRNPAGFLAQIPGAAKDAVGVVAGKVAARGILPLVGFAPTGLLGLLVQTLTGTVVSGGVYMLSKGFGRNMLVGTFGSLYESLARTPVAGKPIPIIGTALSDYGEAYRLAAYAQPSRPVGAYARPTAVTRGGRGVSGPPQRGRLVYVS